MLRIVRGYLISQQIPNYPHGHKSSFATACGEYVGIYHCVCRHYRYVIQAWTRSYVHILRTNYQYIQPITWLTATDIRFGYGLSS